MLGILALIILGAFVGIPILAACSFRKRSASPPETLPAWRNRTGVVSLGVILCGWLFLVVLTILRIINDSWRYILTENMNAGLILLAVAASISCIALKGPARTQAIRAGVLLCILAVLASFWLPGDL
jgi:hypothetical protein